MSLRSAILSVKAQRKSHTRHSCLVSAPPSSSLVPLSLTLLLIHLFSPPKESPSDDDHRAKRYERLMKFHGIHQSQSAGTTAPTMRDTPVASRRKTSPSREANNKKRKLNKLAENSQPDLNVDDDEGFGKVKTEYSTDIKAEPESIKKEDIKDEPTATEENLDPKACNTYNSAMGFDGAIDSAMFDDFLAFGGSPNHYHGSHAASDDGISKEGSASMSMKPATQNGNGEGLHESILITD